MLGRSGRPITRWPRLLRNNIWGTAALHIGMFPTRSRARGQRERTVARWSTNPNRPRLRILRCPELFIHLHCAICACWHARSLLRKNKRWTLLPLCLRCSGSFISSTFDYMILPINLPQPPYESPWNISSWKWSKAEGYREDTMMDWMGR